MGSIKITEQKMKLNSLINRVYEASVSVVQASRNFDDSPKSYLFNNFMLQELLQPSQN